MKPKIILATILFLLGNQSFSQESIIKGRVLDFETNNPIKHVTILSVVSDTLDNGAISIAYENGAATDENGYFEFKGNPDRIEFSYISYYKLKIFNIPAQKKEINLGEIVMVKQPWPTTDSYDHEELEEQKRLLIEKVLEDFRIEIFEKTLKPSFSRGEIVFDCDKTENE